MAEGYVGTPLSGRVTQKYTLVRNLDAAAWQIDIVSIESRGS